MAIKTTLKRIDEMVVGDVMVTSSLVKVGSGYKIDTKNKSYFEVLEPFKDNKIVTRNIETEEMKVFEGYGWLPLDVLVKKAKK